MILIVGKYELLAAEIARKFCDMHYEEDVQVRNSIRLLDYIDAHYQEIGMLFYVDKKQTDGSESSSRLEHLQLLWSIAAKHAIPVFFLFFKYKSDYTLDAQLNQYASWIGKQFRQPPFHYIFKMGELYGLEDRASVVDDIYRQIVETGAVGILRRQDGEGAFVERQLDYLYVSDVGRVLYWFATHRPASGVYELGCGFPRTDTALVGAISRVLRLSPQICYEEIERKFAHGGLPFAVADLSNLRRIGYKKPFYTLENGVKSYLHRPFCNNGILINGC